MMKILYIDWNPSPDVLPIKNVTLQLNWLLLLIGVAIIYFIIVYVKKQKNPSKPKVQKKIKQQVEVITKNNDDDRILTRYRLGSGFYFGFCLTTIFLSRFFIEFLKEAQGGIDDGAKIFDVGQMLSLPFVLMGILCLWWLPGCRLNISDKKKPIEKREKRDVKREQYATKMTMLFMIIILGIIFLSLYKLYKGGMQSFSWQVIVRWYALCWIAGLASAYVLMQWMYKKEGIDPVKTLEGEWTPTHKFEKLIYYVFFGVFLGARIGHCLFYEPDYFVNHPIEILLPIHNSSHGGIFNGFSGLASHGGAIGLGLALLLYVWRHHMKIWILLDMIALVAPLTSFFIRIGNLMNSEIIGKPTDMPWGFIFHTSDALVDGQLAARHPSQLYEALVYLLIFFIGWWLYRSKNGVKQIN